MASVKEGVDGLGIITREDCDCLNRVLELLGRVRVEIDRCKSCGMDTTKAEQEVMEIEEAAKAIKATYFPEES